MTCSRFCLYSLLPRFRGEIATSWQMCRCRLPHDVMQSSHSFTQTLKATTSELVFMILLSCSAARFRVPFDIAHVLIR
jgi:hypothetical protein